MELPHRDRRISNDTITMTDPLKMLRRLFTDGQYLPLEPVNLAPSPDPITVTCHS